ncbi:hypothetical protein GCM10023186_35510 [Hymenobacter koreensis]|uniref:Uncharacterized protein n=1 Tax=Hymenobacter koreensis TaxID=1084523 RepID=A0ABP8JCL6_9BACT
MGEAYWRGPRGATDWVTLLAVSAIVAFALLLPGSPAGSFFSKGAWSGLPATRGRTAAFARRGGLGEYSGAATAAVSTRWTGRGWRYPALAGNLGTTAADRHPASTKTRPAAKDKMKRKTGKGSTMNMSLWISRLMP